MWRHGTPLSSRGVKWLSGFLSSGHRVLGLFLEVPRGRHPSLCVLSRSSGFQSSPCRGIRHIWSRWGIQGLFELRHNSWGCARVSRRDRPPLEGRRQRRDSFPDEEGESTLILMRGGENGALLELWWESQFSSQVETGISGNFLSCLKGVQYPFEAQEGRWDFSRDSAAERGLILR